MYFKLNNTIILYKHREVFNSPQEMWTFVDLTKYFDLRPKHQVYLTRGQQCVWFFNPRPLRPKGYCRHLRLSVCPSVRLSVCLFPSSLLTQ